MFIVCLNSNWCHITQRNKESTRVWDGGKGECLCIFLVFLTKKPSMHQFTLWFFMHIVNTEKKQ